MYDSKSFSLPDADARERLLSLLKFQFDLEILLKRNELQLIKARLVQVQELRERLDDVILRTSQLSHVRPRAASSSTSTNAVRTPLYSMLSEGTFIKWVCPDCQRSDFASTAGLRSHCRNTHRRVFSSLAQMAHTCGVSVAESEVPADHPCRAEPLAFIELTEDNAATRSDLNWPNLEALQQDVETQLQEFRASIKVYDEHINLSDPSSDDDNDADDNGSSSDTSTTLRGDQQLFAQTRRPSIITLPKQSYQQSLNEDETEIITHPIGSNGHVNKADLQTLPSPSQELEAAASVKPTDTNAVNNPIAAQPGSSVDSSGSRFYIHKRVVVGNTSRYIPTDKRTDDDVTHKWTVYVRSPTESEDIRQFVKKVRFFLHPSYAPNDLIDVVEPPFHLRRFGWGEFPVRVQLHFVDAKRNKPVDIIHMLSLDATLTGHEVLGSERTYDIELDRATLPILDTNSSDIQAAVLSVPPSVSSEQSTSSSAQESTQDSVSTDTTTNAVSSEISNTNPSGPYPDVLFLDAVHKFPIVGSLQLTTLQRECSLIQGYCTAESTQQFFRWDTVRRKSTEWRRARQLRLYVQFRSRKQLGSVQAVSTQNSFFGKDVMLVTTKQVLLWCRDRGLMPQPMKRRKQDVQPQPPKISKPKLSADRVLSAKSKQEQAVPVSVQTGPCKRCGIVSHAAFVCPLRPPPDVTNEPKRIKSVRDEWTTRTSVQLLWTKATETDAPSSSINAKHSRYVRSHQDDDFVDVDDEVTPVSQASNAAQSNTTTTTAGPLSKEEKCVLRWVAAVGINTLPLLTGMPSQNPNDTMLSREASSLLCKVMKAFARELIEQSVTELRQTAATATEAAAKNTSSIAEPPSTSSSAIAICLAPTHVQLAANAIPHMDFLTNQYMDS